MRYITVFMGLGLFVQNVLAQTFEVATIRRAAPITPAMIAAGTYHVGMKTDPAQVDIGYSTLAELIRIAYRVKPYQIAGPAWMVDEKWDVLGKIPAGASPEDAPEMLRALLAERFKLVTHRENKEGRIYALEVAKDGPKLTEAQPDDPSAPERIVTSRDGKSTVTKTAGYGITKTEMQPDGSMHLNSSRMTPAQLADALSYYFDRPVVDMTGLTGGYGMKLEFSAADLRYAAAKSGYGQATVDGSQPTASEPLGASLLNSMRKLGLRLEPRQVPLEIIVVDHAERAPDAN